MFNGMTVIFMKHELKTLLKEGLKCLILAKA